MKNWFHNGINFSHDLSYVHVSDVGVQVPNYRKTIQCPGEKNNSDTVYEVLGRLY